MMYNFNVWKKHLLITFQYLFQCITRENRNLLFFFAPRLLLHICQHMILKYSLYIRRCHCYFYTTSYLIREITKRHFKYILRVHVQRAVNILLPSNEYADVRSKMNYYNFPITRIQWTILSAVLHLFDSSFVVPGLFIAVSV